MLPIASVTSSGVVFSTACTTCRHDVVEDWNVCHEVKHKNVVSSEFRLMCKIIFSYFLQARLSALSKSASYFLWEGLFVNAR